MTTEEQNQLQQVVHSNFVTMKEMIDRIESNIAGYHVYRQLSFQAHLQCLITYGWRDSTDPDDSFLNDDADLPSITV